MQKLSQFSLGENVYHHLNHVIKYFFETNKHNKEDVIFCRDYRRCIYIWTNMTDHVIKLEEKDFQLEYSLHCDEDNLTVYYTTFDDAGKCHFILSCTA